MGEPKFCNDCDSMIASNEYCVNSSRGWVHTDKSICKKIIVERAYMAKRWAEIDSKNDSASGGLT